MRISSPPKKWKLNIAYYLSSQAISLFGSSLVDFAFIWYITLETKSAITMAISMMFVYVPKILVSLFSGIWADRYNRKLLTILSDAFIAIVTLVFGILFYSGINDIWLIFLTLGLRSLGSGIQLPASKALIPTIVPEEKLLRVNGLGSSIDSIIMVLSPAVGGLLLAHFSLEVVAMIDVVTAIIGITIFWSIKIIGNKVEKNGEKRSYYNDLKETYTYLKGNYSIKVLLASCILLIILFIPLTLLTPLKIVREFGDDVWRLSSYETINGIGSVFGGVVVAAFCKEKNSLFLICISFFIIGFASLLLSTPIFLVVTCAGFLVGFFLTLANSTLLAVIQRLTHKEYMGRVNGFIQILSNCFYLVGLVLFGVLGDSMNLNYIFIAMAILFTTYSCLTYFKLRKKLKL